MKINQEKFLSLINPNAIVLSDWETFSQGIVGISPDKCHVIYDYNKLLDALTQDMLKTEPDPDEAWENALDWLEYNTKRSLGYMPSAYRPILLEDTSELFADGFQFEAYEVYEEEAAEKVAV